MEPSSGVPWKCNASINGKILHIQCQDSNRYVELEGYFEKIGNGGHHGPSPEVILRFGEAEVAVHATLLAALSSSWREYLHNLDKDLQIIHAISVNIPKGHEFLSALKSLLYSGKTVFSETSVEDLVTTVNNLNLDNLRFTVRNSSNDEQVLCWEGHHDLLTEGLQQLCSRQLCTDLSIFVKGHLIKVHRLVFGAFSPLLECIFQDNKKARVLHLPGFSVESVQNLVSLMYFGRANITKSLIQEFHDLCESFGVNTLELAIKQFCVLTSKDREGEKNERLISVSLKPEIMSILNRLNALYNVKSKVDLTLLVDSKRITTNKAVLSAVCPAVHSLLMEEDTNEHAVILISDADCNSVRALLSIIYEGSCSIAEKHTKFVSSYLDSNIVLIEGTQENASKKEKKRKVQHSKNCVFQNRKLEIIKNKNCCKRRRRKPIIHKEVDCSDVSAEKNSTENNAREEEGQPCHLNRNETNSDVEKKSCELHANSSESASIANQRHCRVDVERTAVPSTSDAQNKLMTEKLTSGLQPKKRCKLSSLYDDDDLGQCLQCGNKYNSISSLHHHMKSHLETPKVMESSAENYVSPPSKDSMCVPKVMESSAENYVSPPSKDSMCVPLRRSHRKVRLPQKLRKHRLTKRCSRFRCDFCEKTYAEKRWLKKHMLEKHPSDEIASVDAEDIVKNNSPKKHLMCLDCNTTFKTRKLLVTHMKSDHKKDEFRCNECSAAFLHPDELRHHKESSHPITDVSCSGCNRRFRRQAALRNHKRYCQLNHTKSPEKETAKFAELEAEDTSQKNITDDRHVAQENLNQSINEVHTASSWKMENKTQEAYKNPLISAAGDEVSTESQIVDFIEFPIPETTNFACPECGAMFDSIESFTVHAEKEGHGHFGKSCWICGICGIAFLEESELNEHFNSHRTLSDEYYMISQSPKKQVIIDDINRLESDVINSSADSYFQREEQNINEVKKKKISAHRAEADSSVMDGETTEFETTRESDVPSDGEMDVVTSSMNN